MLFSLERSDAHWTETQPPAPGRNHSVICWGTSSNRTQLWEKNMASLLQSQLGARHLTLQRDTISQGSRARKLKSSPGSVQMKVVHGLKFKEKATKKWGSSNGALNSAVSWHPHRMPGIHGMLGVWLQPATPGDPGQ